MDNLTLNHATTLSGWESIAAVRNALDDLEYGFESAPDTPGHILDLFYQLIDEIDTWRETRRA